MRQLWTPNSETWRKYTFVMITAQWLASRSGVSGKDSAEDRMKMLNGTLATRQMDDAVKAMEVKQNVSILQDADYKVSSHMQGTTSATAKLRIEKQAELKLFINMCLENGNLERVVEALNGENAQKIVAGDDDFAIHLRHATMKTMKPSQAFEWLRGVVENMHELPDSEFRIDDWQIWKSVLDQKKSCQEDDDGESLKYVSLLLFQIHAKTVQNTLGHNQISTGAYRTWKCISSPSTCKSGASVRRKTWHIREESGYRCMPCRPLPSEHITRLHCG
jgi:hypothetical protein